MQTSPWKRPCTWALQNRGTDVCKTPSLVSELIMLKRRILQVDSESPIKGQVAGSPKRSLTTSGVLLKMRKAFTVLWGCQKPGSGLAATEKTLACKRPRSYVRVADDYCHPLRFDPLIKALWKKTRKRVTQFFDYLLPGGLTSSSRQVRWKALP